MLPVDTATLTSALRVPAELALDFFVAFARFEYALVATGFVHDRHGVAEADWNCFLRFLEELDAVQIAPTIAAGQRLLARSPKKLVLDGQTPRFRAVHR